ncbi:MAG: NCS2 family permease [Methanomicrobium sp.]|nr:NCS2 family permease [Methanomicrobium sp.]
MDILNKIFHLDEYGTTVKTEAYAGFITFFAMAYIIVVNPSILVSAGMPFEAAMAATILTAFTGTLVMGVYANRPFAIAPFMGENAFIAFTVCGIMGYSWQTALGAIFLSGILLMLITVLGGRKVLCESIPYNLKCSFTAGLGLFIILIGLLNTGIIRIEGSFSPVHIGYFYETNVLLAVIGLLIILVLMVRKVRAAIFIGLIFTTIAAFVFGLSPLPEAVVSMPPDMTATFMQMDIAGALTFGMLSVIFSIFILSFLDTMTSIIGVSREGGLLNEEGNLDDIEKPFLADSLANMIAPVLGTTTCGIFIESASGVTCGGRTGLVAVFIALLFAASLFFAPLFAAIPAAASGAVLIAVGFIMFRSIIDIDFKDMTEYLPAIFAVVMMSFTYNIGIGICSAFVVYPIMKAVCGRIHEVNRSTWLFFVLCLGFFILYPY